MNIKKILTYLPSYPHYKMNIFSGTNTLHELIKTFKKLFSDNIINSNEERDYKNKIMNYLNTNHIYTFASGRMGLYTILDSLNLKVGDEIIIPSFTCVVVPNAILYSGMKLIYCDINKNDFNIDISKIEELITEKTKIIYAQHTFGQMCDIVMIKKIAEKNNLIVIEDAALSLGAKLNGKFAGTIGDFGYFSTDRSKIINTGLGGIVSVNNEKYINNFNIKYDYIPYISKKLTRRLAISFILNIITLNPYIYWFGNFLNIILTKFKIITYFSDELMINKNQIIMYPYPARLSSILSNIGISQFDNLSDNLTNRKKKAIFYNNILNIYSDEYINDEKNIFLRYSFLVKNREYWEKRFSSKIDLSIWFKTIVAGRKDKFEEVNYIVGSNLTSEYVCKHIFNLPTHNQIKPDKLIKLIYELKNSGDIITKEKKI